MKTYWDTSAAINAAVAADVAARLDAGEHAARLHLLAEFFAIMTGRGVAGTDPAGQPVRVTFTGNDCAAWLRDFASRVAMVELDTDELLAGLDRAQARNVSGARVYDYGHALAAQKAMADELITRNTEDFSGLTGAVKLAWP